MDGVGVRTNSKCRKAASVTARTAVAAIIMALTLALVVVMNFLLISPFRSDRRSGAGNDLPSIGDGNVMTLDAPDNGRIGFGDNTPFVDKGELYVSASSAFLCTVGGQCIYAKEQSLRLPMASITKVMTAIVALESGVPLDKTVTVDRAAQGVEGSSVYLVAGDSITVGDLLYAVMLSSANDASIALAIGVSGSEAEFVRFMNDKANELGMDDTSFKNPHGLSSDEHYTTAKDYAVLMSYAINDPVFRDIIGTGRKDIYISGNVRTVVNHNRLLYSCDGMIGGKTGYTSASGRTLVTAAERNGVTLICVTLNAPDDWDDHRRMYDKGFSLVKADIYTADELSVQIPVTGATENKTISVKPARDIRIVSAAGKCPEFRYACLRFLYAPIYEGEAVGELRIFADGEYLGSVELVAADNAEQERLGKGEKRSFIDRLLGFLK